MKKIFFLLVLTCFLPSCGGGGGTRGTGTAKIFGIATDRRAQQQLPLKGATVTGEMINISGDVTDADVALTDERGEFLLQFESTEKSVRFTFTRSDLQGQTLFDNLPKDFVKADLKFEISKDKIEIVEARFDTKNKPQISVTAHPSAEEDRDRNPAPLPSPLPTGNVENNNPPTITPTPIATNSPAATITPTATSTPAENGNGNSGNGNNNGGGNGNNGGGNGNNRVTLCHLQGRQRRTIVVSPSAVASHLAHGDTLGACE